MPVFCEKETKEARAHPQWWIDIRVRICDAVFNRNDNREWQMRIHTGDLPFKCELCKAVFNKSKDACSATQVKDYSSVKYEMLSPITINI